MASAVRPPLGWATALATLRYSDSATRGPIAMNPVLANLESACADGVASCFWDSAGIRALDCQLPRPSQTWHSDRAGACGRVIEASPRRSQARRRRAQPSGCSGGATAIRREPRSRATRGHAIATGEAPVGVIAGFGREGLGWPCGTGCPAGWTTAGLRLRRA